MILDISQYQGNINWAAARSGLDLVIFRATIGANTDSKYYQNAKECDLPFGVYHYLKASNAMEAQIEAQFFYSQATAAVVQPQFFIVDIEHKTQNQSNIFDITTRFADTLRSLTNKKIGIYIGQSLYPFAAIKQYDFVWIPRYGKNTGQADTNYLPIYNCDLWQYTDVGSWPGIQGHVDLNQPIGDKLLSWFAGGQNKMAERFSNLHFVEFLKKFVGQPYQYGCVVYACTQSLLNSKTKQYPSHYTQNRMSKYEENIKKHLICADCIGLNFSRAFIK